jgi:hypothetical protein
MILTDEEGGWGGGRGMYDGAEGAATAAAHGVDAVITLLQRDATRLHSIMGRSA